MPCKRRWLAVSLTVAGCVTLAVCVGVYSAVMNSVQQDVRAAFQSEFAQDVSGVRQWGKGVSYGLLFGSERCSMCGLLFPPVHGVRHRVVAQGTIYCTVVVV